MTLLISFVIIQVLDQIAEHGIRIYPLPECDSDEDEEYKEQVCNSCTYLLQSSAVRELKKM